MIYLVYLGMLLCGLYIVTCETAPGTSPPVIDTQDTVKVDTCKPPACYPDPKPPIPPAPGHPRDSPTETQGRDILVYLLEPQTAGVWSWSEGTGTRILCPHYAKLLSDQTFLLNTRKGEEHIEKAGASSSHLHHECISTELSLR
jgi:hypothetical protein